jgi:hypothetical protein
LKSNAKDWIYTTNTKNPSILFVNHEARRAATRKLTVLLKSVIENTNQPSRILINPALDTIYLPGPRTINAIPDLLTPDRSIRFLALDLEDTIAPPELHWNVERPYGKAHLAYCLGLETLTLIIHKYPCNVETRRALLQGEDRIITFVEPDVATMRSEVGDGLQKVDQLFNEVEAQLEEYREQRSRENDQDSDGWIWVPGEKPVTKMAFLAVDGERCCFPEVDDREPSFPDDDDPEDEDYVESEDEDEESDYENEESDDDSDEYLPGNDKQQFEAGADSILSLNPIVLQPPT